MARLSILILAVAVLCPLGLSGQTKKKPVKKTTKPAAVVAPTPKPEETPQPTVPPDEPAKKNNRAVKPVKTSATIKPFGAQYTYTFDRPGFTYPHIVIEHDDSGKGKILMTRKDEDEVIEDPIELTSTTLTNLKKAFDALDFLNSGETYQTPRDYSTMGNIEITVRKDALSRTVKYNWSDNSDARALMDEYRRISNEYTWRLEMASARENQPLLTPSLVETIANYIDRKEISDPGHMLPLLTELSLDERLPLLARNRLKKVIVKIAKDSK